MTRRRPIAPATLTGPLLLTVATLGLGGVPVPHNILIYPVSEWEPAGSVEMSVATADAVWEWASVLQAAPTEQFSDTGASVVVTGTLAGLPVEVKASCWVESPAQVNARDRAADRAELAAARAAGEVL